MEKFENDFELSVESSSLLSKIYALRSSIYLMISLSAVLASCSSNSVVVSENSAQLQENIDKSLIEALDWPISENMDEIVLNYSRDKKILEDLKFFIKKYNLKNAFILSDLGMNLKQREYFISNGTDFEVLREYEKNFRFRFQACLDSFSAQSERELLDILNFNLK